MMIKKACQKAFSCFGCAPGQQPLLVWAYNNHAAGASLAPSHAQEHAEQQTRPGATSDVSAWANIAQTAHAQPVILLLLDVEGKQVLWSNRDIDFSMLAAFGADGLQTSSCSLSGSSSEDQHISVHQPQPNFLSILLGDQCQAAHVREAVHTTGMWCGSVSSSLAGCLVELQCNPNATPGDFPNFSLLGEPQHLSERRQSSATVSNSSWRRHRAVTSSKSQLNVVPSMVLPECEGESRQERWPTPQLKHLHSQHRLAGNIEAVPAGAIKVPSSSHAFTYHWPTSLSINISNAEAGLEDRLSPINEQLSTDETEIKPSAWVLEVQSFSATLGTSSQEPEQGSSRDLGCHSANKDISVEDVHVSGIDARPSGTPPPAQLEKAASRVSLTGRDRKQEQINSSSFVGDLADPILIGQQAAWPGSNSLEQGTVPAPRVPRVRFVIGTRQGDGSQVKPGSSPGGSEGAESDGSSCGALSMSKHSEDRDSARTSVGSNVSKASRSTHRRPARHRSMSARLLRPPSSFEDEEQFSSNVNATHESEASRGLFRSTSSASQRYERSTSAGINGRVSISDGRRAPSSGVSSQGPWHDPASDDKQTRPGSADVSMQMLTNRLQLGPKTSAILQSMGMGQLLTNSSLDAQGQFPKRSGSGMSSAHALPSSLQPLGGASRPGSPGLVILGSASGEPSHLLHKYPAHSEGASDRLEHPIYAADTCSLAVIKKQQARRSCLNHRRSTPGHPDVSNAEPSGTQEPHGHSNMWLNMAGVPAEALYDLECSLVPLPKLGTAQAGRHNTGVGILDSSIQAVAYVSSAVDATQLLSHDLISPADDMAFKAKPGDIFTKPPQADTLCFTHIARVECADAPGAAFVSPGANSQNDRCHLISMPALDSVGVVVSLPSESQAALELSAASNAASSSVTAAVDKKAEQSAALVAEVKVQLVQSSTRPLLLVSCTDISARAAVEGLLAQLMESQLSMVSSLFPYHVLEHLCKSSSSDTKASSSGAMITTGAASALGNAGSVARSDKIAKRHEDATVLFMDIVGFTTMSKELEPHQVLSYLNELFSYFDELVSVHGVHKVETAGDCYIVCAGVVEVGAGGFLHVMQSHDPQVSAQRVLAFAQEMLACSQTVLMPHNQQPTRVRIGIHTGTCMSGLVGSKLPKFSIYGDSVNTASRLESTGKPGRIQVSEATQQLLQGESWEATGGVNMKGKGVMLTYFWSPGDGTTSSQDQSLRSSKAEADKPLAESLKQSSAKNLAFHQAHGAMLSHLMLYAEPAKQHDHLVHGSDRRSGMAAAAPHWASLDDDVSVHNSSRRSAPSVDHQATLAAAGRYGPAHPGSVESVEPTERRARDPEADTCQYRLSARVFSLPPVLLKQVSDRPSSQPAAQSVALRSSFGCLAHINPRPKSQDGSVHNRGAAEHDQEDTGPLSSV